MVPPEGIVFIATVAPGAPAWPYMGIPRVENELDPQIQAACQASLER